ncbi:MAG: hypothetical protein ABIR94_17050 [Rubrivivax sp.]
MRRILRSGRYQRVIGSVGTTAPVSEPLRILPDVCGRGFARLGEMPRYRARRYTSHAQLSRTIRTRLMRACAGSPVFRTESPEHTIRLEREFAAHDDLADDDFVAEGWRAGWIGGLPHRHTARSSWRQPLPNILKIPLLILDFQYKILHHAGTHRAA